MRKVLTVFMLVLICAGALFAGDFGFVLGGVSQHPEILMGLLPSYAYVGGSYNGLNLIEGDKTSIQLLVGGGYVQRKLWQNPVTGEVINSKPLVYDVLDFDWSLRFAQGFLESPVGGKDLITVTAAYEGELEFARDSLAAGKERKNNTTDIIQTLDQFLGGSYSGAIYPELNGNRQFLGTQFSLSLKVDAMEDTIQRNNGVILQADVKWGPGLLNKAFDGYADYFGASASIIGAYTVFAYEDYFTITLVDRANFGYLAGKAVPAFMQGPDSLGRKVRGFNTYTYNTEFTAVNNFDIRLCGPDIGIDGIAPRVNLFFDVGYGWGNLLNTEIQQKNLIMSTGVQGTFCFFDFIDLGYQVAYLIEGSKYTSGADRLSTSFTFFLDF